MQSTKTLVAHFVRGFLPPSETFIMNQLRSLDRFEPIVFCRRRIPSQHFDDLKINCLSDHLGHGARWVEDFAYKTSRILTPIGTAKFHQLLCAKPVRLVHCHFLVDARFFLPVLRKVALPRIVSAYGYDVTRFPNRGYGIGRRYLRRVFDEFDLVIAMSVHMREDIMRLGCSSEKIKVHYHGVDTERFAFPDRSYEQPSTTKILVCARLVPTKGHLLILRALDVMRNRFMRDIDVSLTIIGDGPLRSDLEMSVKRMGLEKVVEFRGYVSSPVDHYRSATMFVLPCLTVNGAKEGIPGSLVEAMASGLPVVSTYHGGIPEVIESERHGILTREGDVDALAAAMVRLASSPELRQSLGKAAASRAVLQFNVRDRAKSLENIYEELLLGDRSESNAERNNDKSQG